MKKLLFLLTFLLTQKVVSQSNDTTLAPYQICYTATDSGIGYSIGDIIEFNVMYNLKNPVQATYFDYFNQNRQAFVYKNNTINGEPIIGAIPPISHLKPCIGNFNNSYSDTIKSINSNSENVIFSSVNASTQSYNLINNLFKNILIYNNGVGLLKITYFTTTGSTY